MKFDTFSLIFSEYLVIVILSILLLIDVSTGFKSVWLPTFGYRSAKESTRLYSNRPQMKVIKNVMHKRPKKHRHSDIHRRNLNKNVCITKIPEWFLIPDYTIESEETYKQDQFAIQHRIENGDPEAKWHYIPPHYNDPIFDYYDRSVTKQQIKRDNWAPLVRTRQKHSELQWEYSNKTVARLKEFEKQFIIVDDFDDIPRKPNNQYCFIPGHGNFRSKEE